MYSGLSGGLARWHSFAMFVADMEIGEFLADFVEGEHSNKQATARHQ